MTITEKYDSVNQPVTISPSQSWSRLSWPDNLMVLVFYDPIRSYKLPDVSDVAKFVYTKDFMGTLEYLLHTLPEQSRTMLLLHFKDKKNYETIAEACGVTYAAVQTTVKKAVEVLSQPNHQEMLTKGLRQYYIDRANRRYDAGYNDGYADGLRVVKTQTEQAAPSSSNKCDSAIILPEEPIEALNLSVRAHNCLKRADINTIQDILNLTYDNLRQIRNLGIKSGTEIIDCMEAAGYNVNYLKQE